MSSSATTAPPIPRYSGVKTFFRRPHIPYNSESFLCARKSFDVAIVGVPFDIGVSFRTGQREGPSAVRNISHLSQVNIKWIYKCFVTYNFTLYQTKMNVIIIQNRNISPYYVLIVRLSCRAWCWHIKLQCYRCRRYSSITSFDWWCGQSLQRWYLNHC